MLDSIAIMISSVCIFILSVCIIILEIDNFRIKKRLNEIVGILELQEKANKLNAKMINGLYAKKWNEKE